MEDKYGLKCFVKKQHSYNDVYSEVSLGRKRSHWMLVYFSADNRT